MTKEIEFENGIDDLITETFETLEELKRAIRYFDGFLLSDFLKAHIETYEEMERTEK